MKPQELANNLKAIADAIDRSERPSKAAVAASLQKLLRVAGAGADKRFVEYALSYENREGLLHDILSGLNECDEQFLKDEGYSSLSALEADDSPDAKRCQKTWELIRKQTDIIGDALRSILPQIVELDRELESIN